VYTSLTEKNDVAGGILADGRPQAVRHHSISAREISLWWLEQKKIFWQTIFVKLVFLDSR